MKTTVIKGHYSRILKEMPNINTIKENWILYKENVKDDNLKWNYTSGYTLHTSHTTLIDKL